MYNQKTLNLGRSRDKALTDRINAKLQQSAFVPQYNYKAENEKLKKQIENLKSEVEEKTKEISEIKKNREVKRKNSNRAVNEILNPLYILTKAAFNAGDEKTGNKLIGVKRLIKIEFFNYQNTDMTKEDCNEFSDRLHKLIYDYYNDIENILSKDIKKAMKSVFETMVAMRKEKKNNKLYEERKAKKNKLINEEEEKAKDNNLTEEKAKAKDNNLTEEEEKIAEYIINGNMNPVDIFDTVFGESGKQLSLQGKKSRIYRIKNRPNVKKHIEELQKK